ncbi:hypothetical protein MUK42_03452 [Musa troglodytarum]|uniref:Uncharacterized protein n=1 Tax=Musa troglodytarum TaxID=320322 RepID=A0A9E7GNY3_9LILI|nr:hypothetical protein MUK42_03452 [Musa troglodytarum]
MGSMRGTSTITSCLASTPLPLPSSRHQSWPSHHYHRYPSLLLTWPLVTTPLPAQNKRWEEEAKLSETAAAAAAGGGEERIPWLRHGS